MGRPTPGKRDYPRHLSQAGEVLVGHLQRDSDDEPMVEQKLQSIPQNIPRSVY
jgi:hypothetical protein